MKDADPLWFQGKITREDAESLLIPRDDGLFLIRESTNFPGDYALCVCFNQRVEHYRVIYNDHKLTIDEEEFFDTLVQLVEVIFILFVFFNTFVNFLMMDLFISFPGSTALPSRCRWSVYEINRTCR